MFMDMQRMADKIPSLSEATTANRAAWNQSAGFHKKGPEWTELVEGFSGGSFSVLDETLTALMQSLEVAGKSVVQVGCNNGRDLLSLKSLGAADCTGIDQSDAFIAQACELRDVAKLDCSFVCADVYDLPGELSEKFDLALITIGVINWMPDLSGFFDAVAGLLKSGGKLAIYETHPFLEMFDPASDTPLTPAFSYFDPEPYVESETIVYDGSKHDGGLPSYWYIHTIGDILNACIGAGLRVEQFTEYSHSNREVEYDLYQEQAAQLPMCYTLVAGK
jgi:SAM-dependent methyltransferase